MSAQLRLPFITSDKIIYAMDGVFTYMLHAVLELTGRLDESLLERAIEYALVKSPILKSVARLKPLGSYWEVVDDLTPYAILTVNDLSSDPEADTSVAALLQAYINEAIDITASPPTRFLLIQLPDNRCVFVMKVHHCAVDPAGMLHCLDDIQTAYRHLLNGEALPPVSPMPSRSRRQLFRHVSPLLWLRVIGRAAISLVRRQKSQPRGFVQFDDAAKSYRQSNHCRTSQPHGFAQFDGGRSSCTVAYRTVQFKGRDYTKFRARCKSFGVTANELVMAALCCAIRRWNGQRERPDAVYSIVMPVDLRWYLRQGGQVPRIMANFIGGSWISVPAAYVTTFEETIQYIARQTRFIKDGHMGLLANLGMPVVKLLPPRWLRRAAQRMYQRHPQRMVPTAVFAYLGKVERIMTTFPGCQLTGIAGVGAGFDPVGLDVVVVNFDHVFSVTVTYLRDVCPDAQMDRFMMLLTDQILGNEEQQHAGAPHDERTISTSR
ncbi:MAG: condensation domain-containing protein [Acidobacteriota bacterium]|nr:condensation domain-containing protein [Blastocatellia bacterium]MDW8240010.1 condensation domain-containing protein [Acidobacteriota bacterium]